ncbi:MAG TPA: trehalose-phosphatase [Syntrophus sp. (in: bacteria)]|nr:trehalose-phosphatase [Syntrophus sp. (in: bacteria)]
MTYLFSDAGLDALRSFVDSTTLLAFDLDGTLAPIVADPSRMLVSNAIQEELAKLMEQTTVAVITGRGRTNAQAHLGMTPHFLIGNHGAEGLPGRKAYESEYLILANNWERQLRGMLACANGDGIVIENKGATVSVHYRASCDRAATRSHVLSVIELLSPPPRTISGKCVEDLVPATAPNKGDALQYLMKHLGYHKGFYIGDDKTDEDVFKLTGQQLFTVRVGIVGPSQAGYTLRSQQEVHKLLRDIAFLYLHHKSKR